MFKELETTKSMRTFAFLRINPLFEDYKKIGITTISCGRYNGYVGIIGGDNLSLENRVLVHGGINFDGKFGGTEEIIPLTEIPADWWKYRIVGFGCAHFGDTEDNCPFEFVREETMRLRKQIERLNKDK